ncbi:hypothetical protein [Streptomyces gobiensis]|uniref:hypothetical protein n=1 Tax=Streptomyces gobiensis TaxID=2875706 RepID=UPI001E40CA9B|nr:hypothetical protein [Streptomyces gobiensis]UGY92729.1 hypothetical protein test1122_14035 [Streptomyces gobiensis]
MKMRSLAAAAASTALVLTTAGPAVAGGDPSDAGGLKIIPSSAGAGATVKVKALCKAGGEGTVASRAFEESRALLDGRHHDGDHHDGDHHDDRDHGTKGKEGKDGKEDMIHHHKPFAKATVRHEGLKKGETFKVVGFCKDGKQLTGTFTFTGVSGGAHAGLGGLSGGSGSSLSVTTTTAASVAGGLAVAGVAGYVLVWRRRAGADHA